jgi:diguanylate cyclase (GGDEF)-like protein
MTIEELIQFVNASLSTPLTPLQEFLLRQTWEGKTYAYMAQEIHYGPEYLRKTASSLWSALSELWGEPISKSNLRQKIEGYRLTKSQQQLIDKYYYDRNSQEPFFFPGGPIPLDSPFYIPRYPVEELAYEEIRLPGSVIRIKAPRKMGKSSLMLRILEKGKQEGLHGIKIDFQQAEREVFSSLNRFLRWFSANVARQLQLDANLDRYWDADIGTKVSCTVYFQGYLLANTGQPIILALNEVNQVFEHPEIAKDFLSLLRGWYEQSKQEPIWQKLRLILVYSTEIYVPLEIHQSPFNVGLPLKLPPFSLEQAQELAYRYGCQDLTATMLKKLVDLVGGHPYLISQALYHTRRYEVPLEQILHTAFTPKGIYQNHLQSLMVILQSQPQLATAMQQVVNSPNGITLDPVIAYKLESLGLVRLDDCRVTVSCELYRRYFKAQLPELNLSPTEADPSDATPANQPEIKETSDRQSLPILGENLDETTQIANRNSFYRYLQAKWQQSASDRTPISLILCEVPLQLERKTLSLFGDLDGYTTAENCLQQVADIIQTCIRRQSDLAARYGSKEFAIILPQADSQIAAKVAERIRQSVKDLQISVPVSDAQQKSQNLLTISLGVASAIANSECSDATAILLATDFALRQSQSEGGDRVTVNSKLLGE